MQKPSEMYDFLVKSYPPKIAEDIFRIKSYFKYFLAKDVQVIHLTSAGIGQTNEHLKSSEITGSQKLVYIGQFYPTPADIVTGSGGITLRSINVNDIAIDFYQPFSVMCLFDEQWQGYMNGNIYKVIEL